MSMGHAVKIFKPSSEDKNPMNRRNEQYDHLFSKVQREKFGWMIFAILEMMYICLSLVLFKHAIDLPKAIPLVIEVAPWGESKNVGDISKYSYGTIQVPENSREWQIKDFVRKLRSVSTDANIVHDNVSSLYTMITNTCADKLTENLKHPDIFSFVGKKTVSVTFESILKISQWSYQVDWIEKTKGDNAGQRRYRGIVTICLLTPTEKQADDNPLGIYIRDYDITEIKSEYGEQK